jgi:hypothetical protein
MNKPSRIDTVLTTLKELLRDEHDFGKTVTFFHDKVVPHPNFSASGKPQKNPLLKQMLTALFEQKFPSDPVTLMHFIHVRSAKFWHGSVLCKSGLGVVIYFEDIAMGLCTYVPSLTTTNTEFVRFSTAEVPQGVAYTASGPRGKA